PYLAECFRLAAGKSDRFRRAEQLEARGRLEEAVQLLGEVVERTPDAQAYVGLGRNLARLGRPEQAERALRSALRLSPDNVQAHYHLGRLAWERAERLRRQGGGAEVRALLRSAADHARRAVARKPDDGPAHLLLGLALEGLGDKEQALAELE